MPEYIITPEGRRLKKLATHTTTPVSDTTVKQVYTDAPRVCYNMPNEEFFPLMLQLRDKAVHLMGDRLTELVRWNAADRDKVVLWFGEDSETTRRTLSDGLTRMREIMRGLTEKNFVKFTREGVRAVGCEPRSEEGFATASVCKADGTFTIFLDAKFCEHEAERNQIGTGIPFDKDSKLTILIHEISHFPQAMDTGDPFYSYKLSREAAQRRDEFCTKNADNLAFYISNLPNWDHKPHPLWKP